MDRLKLSRLEQLLQFPGSIGVVHDASVLTCGCLVSASQFEIANASLCPKCYKQGVHLLATVEPLRDLYHLILNIKSNSSSIRRQKSSSKRSIKSGSFLLDQQITELNEESTDLLTLFYQYAKENESPSISTNAKVAPISINNQNKTVESFEDEAYKSSFLYNSRPTISSSIIKTPPLYEHNREENIVLNNLNEAKEYNFSKCYPFHRKLTTFPTLQLKLNSTSNPFKNSILRRNPRYNASSIHSYQDLVQGMEITKFVLMTVDTWEVFEYAVPIDLLDTSNIKPRLLCCGKSNGEYGKTFKSLKSNKSKEFIVKSDSSQIPTDTTSECDDKSMKILNQWQFFNCQISKKYLLLSGSNGVVRLINLEADIEYEVGQPVYTFFSEYPVRCISLSPNDELIATSITAINKMDKEQPFIILHKLENEHGTGLITSISRISISLPTKDPLKQINFNAASSHVICCTAWEHTILIVKLADCQDNYRKPRLIFSGNVNQLVKIDDDLLRATEGITSVQFEGSNHIIVSSSTLETRGNPPMIFKLGQADKDTFSQQSILSDEVSLKGLEVVRRINEVGSMVYGMALSPRGDGIVFLGKDGQLYLVQTHNYSDNNKSIVNKQAVVLIGEVTGAEKYQEAASVKFGPDGAKIFTVDRKGIFSIFDFAKGAPGQDLDVVRCKIISSG